MISLKCGVFTAIERQGFCPDHPSLPPARSRELERVVPAGANVAYDALVRIGLARFVECRQIREIQREVARDCGVGIRPSTISHQAQKFIAYLEVVHGQSRRMLRRDMAKRGGYILHIDGTCEEGSQVLLVCFDSLSEQVLESRKIASENIVEVARVLKNVRRDWGVPLAVVHDLRGSLIAAAAEAFPKVPQFVCHYHFAADVGKDILDGGVDRLRRLFQKTKVRARLGALRRSLREFAATEGLDDHVVSQILQCDTACGLADAANAQTIKGTVHALASWILAFFRAGDGYGFPFDMPYLVLYDRVVKVYEILDGASVLWSDDRRAVTEPLRRLKRILESVVLDKDADDFVELVAELRKQVRVFGRLRAALRICEKGGKQRRNDEGARIILSPDRHKDVLKRLRDSLLRQARRDPMTERACRLVVEHLDKYWKYLFGHLVVSGPNPIVVPRTNNVEERLFRTIKRQCRRLHGRGHLSRDVDAMPAGTALLLNLTNASYCATVFGGMEAVNIAERFSAVDPKLPAKLLKSRKRERVRVRIPRKFEALADLPDRLGPFIGAASEKFQG